MRFVFFSLQPYISTFPVFLFFRFSEHFSKNKGENKNGTSGQKYAALARETRGAIARVALAKSCRCSRSFIVITRNFRGKGSFRFDTFYSFMFSIFLMLRVCVWGGDRIDF